MSSSSPPPIDGRAWSAYTSAGRQHFDRVTRSRAVFLRNANELMGLLTDAEDNIINALSLFGAVPARSTPENVRQAAMADVRTYADEFWPTLDQRLHNLVSSVKSLIDHTRPLTRFYENEPEFQQEFDRRNGAIADDARSRFVGDLRNYLGPRPSESHLEIKLSSPQLLAWSKWSSKGREFIGDHPDGLHVRQIIRGYVTDMVDLYSWLFGEYSSLHEPGTPPRHLREGRRSEVVYGPVDEGSETQSPANGGPG
jgi:hypothetical protein